MITKKKHCYCLKLLLFTFIKLAQILQVVCCVMFHFTLHKIDLQFSLPLKMHNMKSIPMDSQLSFMVFSFIFLTIRTTNFRKSISFIWTFFWRNNNHYSWERNPSNKKHRSIHLLQVWKYSL
jgi:hypothetical protein